MSLTAVQADQLADKITALALTWAGNDPVRLAEAVKILEGTPCLGES